VDIAQKGLEFKIRDMDNKEFFIKSIEKELVKMTSTDDRGSVEVYFNNNRIKGFCHNGYSGSSYHFIYSMWAVSAKGKRSNLKSVFDTEVEANNYCEKTKLKTSEPKLEWSLTDDTTMVNQIIDKIDTPLKVVQVVIKYDDDPLF
jgi:hypothetical protein